MAVPRSKTSKAVTKRRQSINMKLEAPQLVECNNCGNLVQSHHVAQNVVSTADVRLLHQKQRLN